MNLFLSALIFRKTHPSLQSIVRYLDGEPDSGRSRIRRHLRDCEACRTSAERYRRLLALLEQGEGTGPGTYTAGRERLLAAMRELGEQEAARTGPVPAAELDVFAANLAMKGDRVACDRTLDAFLGHRASLALHRQAAGSTGRNVLPFLILPLTGLQLAAGLVLWTSWQMGGAIHPLLLFFTYAGQGFLLLSAAAEAFLAGSIAHHFEPDEPMSRGWLLLMAAGAARFVGTLIAHTLPRWRDVSHSQFLTDFGLLLGGPVQLALLVAGLGVALGLHKRLGLLGKLTARDWLILGAGAGFAVHQVTEWQIWNPARRDELSLLAMLRWAEDPLLVALLAEALLLARTARQLGSGLLASCWRSYAWAGFLTAFGDLCLWAVSMGYLTWPANSLTWFIWFPAAAAFALAPAWQYAAVRRALYGPRAAPSAAVSQP